MVFTKFLIFLNLYHPVFSTPCRGKSEELLRQLSYALKTQLNAPKAPTKVLLGRNTPKGVFLVFRCVFIA